MRLPFQRSKDPATERSPRAAAVDDTAAVEAARTRAKRRLIGAAVLLAAGVIGFPMLFETRPRPLPMDTPIEIRPRDLAAATPTAPSMAPAPREPVPPPAPVPEAGAGVAIPAVPAASASTPPEEPAAPAPAAATPAAIPPQAPEPQPVAAAPPARPPPEPPATRTDDGARAQALLEGKTAQAPASGRFVVQIGAYSDDAALRSARQRVEKLGLKTYTQVVETEAGKRTRVRIGPYASRDEADAAAAKVKGAGLPANILAL